MDWADRGPRSSRSHFSTEIIRRSLSKRLLALRGRTAIPPGSPAQPHAGVRGDRDSSVIDMAELLQLPELPLMLAGISRPVESLLREAGIPAEPLPQLPLLAAGTGRFVLFDGRSPRSAAHARRAGSQGLRPIGIQEFLPTTDDLAPDHDEVHRGWRPAMSNDTARAFLERLSGNSRLTQQRLHRARNPRQHQRKFRKLQRFGHVCIGRTSYTGSPGVVAPANLAICLPRRSAPGALRQGRWRCVGWRR